MSILFISATRLGDAILSTGLLNHLLERSPDDGVTIACGAPAAKVFEAVPRLERLHVIEKRRADLHWLDLWRAVVRRRWRVVVDLRRTLVPLAIRAEARYVLPKSDALVHRVELISRTLDLAPQAPTIWIREEHERRAAELLQNRSAILSVAPGANWAGKIWPAERFVELARRLVGPGGLLDGAAILVVGAAEERETSGPLLAAFPQSRVIDALGLDVLSTYAALKRCRLFVGNDSAMMHLAAATGNPTVGLFGPTRDEHYAPWGKNGLVVATRGNADQAPGCRTPVSGRTASLMDGLSVDAVESAIRRRWNRLPAPLRDAKR